MSIPKRAKIGGITYRIVIAKNWLDRGDANGMADFETNKIYIDEGLSKEAQQITFLHEALHCMNSTINHEFLDSLAEQLYQFLQDNKLLR